MAADHAMGHLMVSTLESSDHNSIIEGATIWRLWLAAPRQSKYSHTHPVAGSIAN